MNANAYAPWHKESYSRYLNERLPQLLAERLPLAGYEVTPCACRTHTVRNPQTGEEYEVSGAYACRLSVSVSTGNGAVTVSYAEIPQPDDDGLFVLDGHQRVILPLASSEALEDAEIRCVGEQAYDFIAQRLGQAPSDLPWDESLLRSWLPLDTWIAQFLRQGTPWNRDPNWLAEASTTSHYIDALNWLAKHVHLRRVIVPERTGAYHPSERGRGCPFETAEGPNIARIFTVANGAHIRDGRIVPAPEDSPEALGLTALMVPFLEHNDANRQLMGVNMMRQWCLPPNPEPALVQTGYEPDAPGFWCGRNLLTAFVSWGGDTFEDAIVLSESCAKRLAFPYDVECGDKLSNRHGTKGTVSRILPDDQMPHLPDGTPVELVFSFMGCHTRLNFGQIREAIWGRVARAEGEPVLAPPFGAPNADALRQRLVAASLPESGMETLTLGKGGEALARPSTVGWVYWGKTHHLAKSKLRAVAGERPLQDQGELEYLTLRDAGAFETIREHYGARAHNPANRDQMLKPVAVGRDKGMMSTPMFENLRARLQVAGIQADLNQDTLAFGLSNPETPSVTLAAPVPHPWLPDQELAAIGELMNGEADEAGAFQAVCDADAKLGRMLENKAPESLVQQARSELQERIQELFALLLTPEHLLFAAQTHFSGRAVMSPDTELAIDQVGIPEEMAWTLFGPRVAREVGETRPVEERTPEAAHALDAVMTRSWVLVERAPALLPTSFMAFHPVRCPGNVVRVNILFNRPTNSDYDGDQVTVFLPLSDAAQREAGERLSMIGHLTHNPGLLRDFVPSQEPIWGLAALSLRPGGTGEISRLAGVEVVAPSGFVDRASVIASMETLLRTQGAETALRSLNELVKRGLLETMRSGASINPFIGETLELPPAPGDDPDAWDEHVELIAERIASRSDYDDPDIGPQLLAVKAHARGSLTHLVRLASCYGVARFGRQTPAVIGNSFAAGLTLSEAADAVVSARTGLAEIADESTSAMHVRAAYGLREPARGHGFNVLARAMRAKRPGVVFAQAAATGESDPLIDLDSRLFVGLPPL